jgi:CRP-like cAMP-binding protein
MRTAAFLRNVPVLQGKSDELPMGLAGQINEVRVRAGTWIIRAGESADSMFIVRSGRLEVIEEGPPEALIRVLRRGDVLGELALLREETPPKLASTVAGT